jgi:hypothetical protein
MSLADILQLAAVTHMPRRTRTQAEMVRDWHKRNRPHLNAYRRKWRASKKGAAR